MGGRHLEQLVLNNKILFSSKFPFICIMFILGHFHKNCAFLNVCILRKVILFCNVYSIKSCIFPYVLSFDNARMNFIFVLFPKTKSILLATLNYARDSSIFFNEFFTHASKIRFFVSHLSYKVLWNQKRKNFVCYSIWLVVTRTWGNLIF